MNRTIFERMSNLSAYNSAKVDSSFKSNGAFTVVKFVPPMTKESSLAKYKLLYKDQLRLKLSPIKNYADIDRIVEMMAQVFLYVGVSFHVVNDDVRIKQKHRNLS